MVRVKLWLWLFPWSTLPKFKLVGVEIREPGETPVPLRGIFKGVVELLLVTATFPLAAPGDDGAKVAVKFKLCPAASEAGRESPVI